MESLRDHDKEKLYLKMSSKNNELQMKTKAE